MSYYPRKITTFREFQDEFKGLELEIDDEDELDRLEHISECDAPPALSSVPPGLTPDKQTESPLEGSAEKEEGEGYVLMPCVCCCGAVLTSCSYQEEMSEHRDDLCGQCGVYHHCIEEGNNIPDMTTKDAQQSQAHPPLDCCPPRCLGLVGAEWVSLPAQTPLSSAHPFALMCMPPFGMCGQGNWQQPYKEP